jgi:hypothetical protein
MQSCQSGTYNLQTITETNCSFLKNVYHYLCNQRDSSQDRVKATNYVPDLIIYAVTQN